MPVGAASKRCRFQYVCGGFAFKCWPFAIALTLSNSFRLLAPSCGVFQNDGVSKGFSNVPSSRSFGKLFSCSFIYFVRCTKALSPTLPGCALTFKGFDERSRNKYASPCRRFQNEGISLEFHNVLSRSFLLVVLSCCFILMLFA